MLSLVGKSFSLRGLLTFDDKNFLLVFISLRTANYDPTEDEYARKNGHVTANGEAVQNNNLPITAQPVGRMQRNISTNR